MNSTGKDFKRLLNMVINKFKEFPKDRTLLLTIVITFIPFFIMTLIICINELRLVSSTGFGVLDFELARTPDMINTIFTAWGPIEMQKQISIHYLDLFYAPCYGIFGWGCVLFMSRKLDGKLLDLGIDLSLATIIAGVFDELENINLLMMLKSGSPINANIPLLASLFATLKIGFIGAGLGFLYIAFTYWIVRKYNKSSLYLYSALFGGGVLVMLLLLIWSPFLSVMVGVLYFILVLVSLWVKEL